MAGVASQTGRDADTNMTGPVQAHRCVSSSATDIGCVRALNEDALLERAEIGLWAVADGMGGHEAGDFASRTIVESLSRVTPPLDAASFLRDVQWHIRAAHQALLEEAARRGSAKTIGSTVVALLVFGQEFTCVWAGDSRLYLLRDCALRQVTRDHSLVQDLVDAGSLDAAEAENHPHANVITRAVGAAAELALDKSHGQLGPGDRLLLCSDGLTRYVPEDEIAGILIRAEVEDAAAALVQAALLHQTRDNVSAIVIDCHAATGTEDDLADTLPRTRGAVSGAPVEVADLPVATEGDQILDRILNEGRAGHAPEPLDSGDTGGADPEPAGRSGLFGRFNPAGKDPKD